MVRPSFAAALLISSVLSLAPLSTTAKAQDNLNDSIISDIETDGREVGEPRKPKSHSSVAGTVLLYIPNRIFDLLDIVRLRVRVGPGIAAGVRVTKPLSLYAGTYTSVFAGLPGPRQESTIPLPVGLESHNGVGASLFDATVDGGIGPNYSPAEVGVSVHAGIIGADVGIDPWEIIDFLGGIFLFDVVGDDF